MKNSKIFVIAPKKFMAIDFARRTDKDINNLVHVSSVNDLIGIDGSGKVIFVLHSESFDKHYSPSELVEWAKSRRFNIEHVFEW